MKKRTIFIIIFILILISLPVIYFITKPSVKITKKAVPVIVHVQLLKPMLLSQTVTTYGTIAAPDSINLKAQTSGVITSINFIAGEKIKQNKLLFTLKSNDTSSQLKTLKAEFEIAKQHYDRALKLSKSFKGGISEIDLLQKKSMYEQTLSQFNEAKSVNMIVSPIDGIISDTNLAVGDFVNAGDVLANIINKMKLQIEYQLPIKYAHRVKIGQKVYFTAGKLNINATVSYISTYVSNDGNLIKLRADIINSSDILPNTFGKIEQILNPKAKVLAVSQNLIQADANGFYVYLLKDHKVSQQYITLDNLTKAGFMIIKKGLKINDTLITTSPDHLNVGEKVQVQK